MSRNSFGGRASLGGDTAELKGLKATKAAPIDEKMTYGFPILKMSEIVQCLHALEFKVTQNQLADIENHKEVYKDILESLAEMCVGVTREEMAQPAFAGLQQLENPQLHEESVPNMNSFRAVGNMMKVCGINDFSIRDFLNPNAKRLKKQLSGIVNFIRYREEQENTVMPLAEERNKNMERLAKLRVENESFASKIAELREATKAEAGLMAEKEEEIVALEDTIKSRNELQVELRNEITELKELNGQLKTSIVSRTAQVEEALNTKKKLQSQIVSSPARFKKSIADAEWTLKTEENDSKQAEKKVHEYIQWRQVTDETSKKVTSALHAINDVRAEVEKQGTYKTQVDHAKVQRQEKREALAALSQNVQQVVRQSARAEEKLQHLRKQAASKNEEASRAIDELHKEIIESDNLRVQIRQRTERAESSCVQAEREAQPPQRSHRRERSPERILCGLRLGWAEGEATPLIVLPIVLH
jgi:kinetochore protein Nuf2